jgi:hypothetical protein
VRLHEKDLEKAQKEDRQRREPKVLTSQSQTGEQNRDKDSQELGTRARQGRRNTTKNPRQEQKVVQKQDKTISQGDSPSPRK